MSRVPAENQSSRELNPTTPTVLPDDITCDIVSRLPPREACYFKTFSKNLNQRLSDPSFKNLHQQRLNENPKLCIASISNVENRGQKGEIVEEHFLRLSALDLKEEGPIHNGNITRKIDPYTRMMSATNGGGLTCFASHKEFFIFNPTSKRFANLPEISFSTNDYVSEAGFGYVPTSNEYIFVHMFDVSDEDDDDFDMRCEWLTLSEINQHEDLHISLSWKVIETPCPFPAGQSGVLVNGLFYFCVSEHCDHTVKQVIFSVDLKNERFNVIGHPDETLYEQDNTRFVVELNGQLCFGDIFEDFPGQMDLWILKNAEKTEWVKLCRVDFDSLDSFDERFASEITLLGLINEELIIHNMKYDKLDYYNIEEETAREGTVSVPTWSQICIYTPSLSFLNIWSSQ